MTFDGIWTSEIMDLFGWETTGVLVLENGRAIDGGNHHYSTGKYEQSGNEIKYVVNADIKKHARLNCIRHLLEIIPYEDMTPQPIKRPKREARGSYVRPPWVTRRLFPGTTPDHSVTTRQSPGERV